MCKNSIWDLINSIINRRDERDVQTTGGMRGMCKWLFFFLFISFIAAVLVNLLKLPLEVPVAKETVSVLLRHAFRTTHACVGLSSLRIKLFIMLFEQKKQFLRLVSLVILNIKFNRKLSEQFWRI